MNEEVTDQVTAPSEATGAGEATGTVAVTDRVTGNRRWFGVAGGLALLVGLGWAALTVFGNDSRFADSALIGKPMPAMALADVDSGQARPIESPGNVLVVNFWAPWCVPCRTEHPLLNTLAVRYADHAVRFVGVTYQSNLGDAAAFLDRGGRGMPNVFDPDGRAGIEFGVVGVPETFFIDRAGIVRARVIGPVSEALVVEVVDRLLAGEPVPAD